MQQTKRDNSRWQQKAEECFIRRNAEEGAVNMAEKPGQSVRRAVGRRTQPRGAV